MKELILKKFKQLGIGETPLVPLTLGGNKGEVFVKLEYLNPAGSIKDRAACYMVFSALYNKKIKEGATIVEASSGNQGIALAMVCANSGLKAMVAVPEHTSKEKIAILKAYGAKVFICPDCASADDPRSHFSVARRLASEIEGAFLLNQFYNLDNPKAHYATTAPEIWTQTKGKVTYFFAGMGSCGTICGVGKYLKEKNPNIKIIGVDAKNSKLSSSSPEPYQIEGIGVDILDGNYQMAKEYLDDIVPVSDEAAFDMTKEMAKRGYLLGLSSGAVLYAVRQYAGQIKEDDICVAIAADSGRYYLSKLF